jgi:hypothetical protein
LPEYNCVTVNKGSEIIVSGIVIRKFAGLVAWLVLCTSPLAQGTTITFDEPGLGPIGSDIGDFYSADGVFFRPGVWTTNNTFGGAGDYAITLTDYSYMNVVDGFNGTLSLLYATFNTVAIELFDELDGRGSLLSSTTVPGGPPDLSYLDIDFSGTAHSIRINGLGSSPVFFWDNITFERTVSLHSTPYFLVLGLLAMLPGRMRS